MADSRYEQSSGWELFEVTRFAKEFIWVFSIYIFSFVFVLLLLHVFNSHMFSNTDMLRR